MKESLESGVVLGERNSWKRNDERDAATGKGRDSGSR